MEKVEDWIFDTIRDWRTRLENEIGEWPIVTSNAIGCIILKKKTEIYPHLPIRVKGTGTPY